MGATRPMLHDQGLLMHLWAKSCNTSVYVKNRCPHRILGMSTPKEAFTGKKLDVSHFKIFCSFVYVHVTKDARKKLEPTVEVGIFMEYTQAPHNYHVYFPKKIMTVVRRDIKFYEGKAMQLSLERELELHADRKSVV